MSAATAVWACVRGRHMAVVLTQQKLCRRSSRKEQWQQQRMTGSMKLKQAAAVQYAIHNKLSQCSSHQE
jgi:hypothetical protein